MRHITHLGQLAGPHRHGACFFVTVSEEVHLGVHSKLLALKPSSSQVSQPGIDIFKELFRLWENRG